MKHLLCITLALVACKDDKPAAPSPAPATPAPATAPAVDATVATAPSVDACRIGKTALDHAKCESPEVQANLMAAKKSIDGIIDTLGQLGAGNPQQFQIACAQLLLAIERDAAKTKCQLALDPARRTEIVDMLETWYAQRTPVTPTGDAAADVVIEKIAKVRDAACACNDGACLDALGKQLDAAGTLPANAPQSARDLGSKLIEDAARCAARVRTLKQ